MVGGPICEPPRRITAEVNRSRLRWASRLGAERLSRPGLGPGATRDRRARNEFVPFTVCQVYEMERGRKKEAEKIKGTGRNGKIIRTDALLVPRSIRLLANLINLEPIGGRAIQLVASRIVTCSIGHKQTSVMQPLRRKKARQGRKF